MPRSNLRHQRAHAAARRFAEDDAVVAVDIEGALPGGHTDGRVRIRSDGEACRRQVRLTPPDAREERVDRHRRAALRWRRRTEAAVRPCNELSFIGEQHARHAHEENDEP